MRPLPFVLALVALLATASHAAAGAPEELTKEELVHMALAGKRDGRVAPVEASEPAPLGEAEVAAALTLGVGVGEKLGNLRSMADAMARARELGLVPDREREPTPFGVSRHIARGAGLDDSFLGSDRLVGEQIDALFPTGWR